MNLSPPPTPPLPAPAADSSGAARFALAEDCAVCGTPLAGLAGRFVRLIGVRRSARNPNVCSRCDVHAQEGRVVEMTVLFADLSSFTELTQELGPEEVHRMTQAFLEEATRAVVRHDGLVDKYLGDAVMALFNVPIRRADHAARALAAAEELRAAMPALSRRLGLELHCAAGIATGHARVGRAGSNERRDYTAVGNVVNLAARLEGKARAGEIVLDGEAYRRSGSRSGSRAGAVPELLDLKGFSEPVSAHRLAIPDSAGQTEGARTGSHLAATPGPKGWGELRLLHARAGAAALALLGAPCAAASVLGPAASALGAASLFQAAAVPVLSFLDRTALRIPLLASAALGTLLNLSALARARSLRREGLREGLAAERSSADRRRSRRVLAAAALTAAAVAWELWAHQRMHGAGN